MERPAARFAAFAAPTDRSCRIVTAGPAGGNKPRSNPGGSMRLSRGGLRARWADGDSGHAQGP